MKVTKPYLAIVLLICLISCKETLSTDDDKKCGEEAVAGFTVRDYGKYASYNSLQIVGNASYLMSYSGSDGLAQFKQIVKISTSCTDDDPLVSLTLELNTDDPLITDSAYANEGSIGKNIDLPLIKSGKVFFEDHEYPMSEDNGLGTLIIYHTCSFPTQGSWSADSAYFFSRLAYMSTSVGYHRPKE